MQADAQAHTGADTEAGRSRWPASAVELVAEQERLAAATPEPWVLPDSRHLRVAGCYVCFPSGIESPGRAGNPAWAAAVLRRPGAEPEIVTVQGEAAAAYTPGLLALREGPLLEAAVRALTHTPAVLLVNATGRDHPRRAGQALHLGARLGVPSVGVTQRPLLAEGPWPSEEHGASTPLELDGEVVARWVRTRATKRPLVAHAAWRTDVDTAVSVVVASSRSARTPEPLRLARRAARWARSAASGNHDTFAITSSP